MRLHTLAQNCMKCLAGLFIFAQSALCTVQTVTDTAKASTVSGSLLNILSNLSSGDTVLFNIAQHDTLMVASTLTIRKDVFIDGINKSTGNRISLKNVELRVINAKATVSNLIFLDFLYGGYTVYGVIADSGSSCIVALKKIEIHGKFVFDNDYSINPAIYNYPGATMNLDSVRVLDCPGGGLENQNGIVTIDHSEFLGNSTYGSGNSGGIQNYNGVVTISNSTIDGNDQDAAGYSGGWYAGGGIFNADGIMTIFNSTISNNRVYNKLTWSIDNPSAKAFGGGIASYHSPSESFPTICSIFNSTFCANTSYGGSEVKNVNPQSLGGGAYLGPGSYITNCTFYSDSVQGVASGGGLTPSALTLSGPEIYADATPFLLNTVILKTQKNISSLRYSSLKGRNNFSNDTNSSNPLGDSTITFGFTTKSLMGKDPLALFDRGGLTKTIPVYANALVVGKGIKAGYYKLDTTFTNEYITKATLYIPVYHNGTAWISAKSGLPITIDTAVVPLDFDQRGKLRSVPPCAGAFEYTADDITAIERCAAKNLAREDLFFAQGRIHIASAAPTKVKIDIFNLAGALLFSCSREMSAGASYFDLPIKTNIAALCKVTFSDKVTMVKQVFIQKAPHY
jgi:hypothetical protein